MTLSTKRAAPGTHRAGPASHAISDAATGTVPPSGSPPDSGTTPSSDWLGERHFQPAAAPPPGIAIETKPRNAKAQRGQAIESRRGQR